jgi:predicted RNA binding protein YcfA (HicA-like mRNA interferase family)
MTGELYAPATRSSYHADALLTLMSGEFPSLKARQLLRVLGRLGYQVTRRGGSSHRWLEAEGRPRLLFSHHDRVSVSPARVREILTQAGLTVEEALKVIHDD